MRFNMTVPAINTHFVLGKHTEGLAEIDLKHIECVRHTWMCFSCVSIFYSVGKGENITLSQQSFVITRDHWNTL